MNDCPEGRGTDHTVLGNRIMRVTGLVTDTHVTGDKWRRRGWSVGTRDSGIGMERTHGTGWALESGFPDNRQAKRDFGVDSSTPSPVPEQMTGPNATIGAVLPDTRDTAVAVTIKE